MSKMNVPIAFLMEQQRPQTDWDKEFAELLGMELTPINLGDIAKEQVGACFNIGPLDILDNEPGKIPSHHVCTLPNGHGGKHSDGKVEWS